MQRLLLDSCPGVVLGLDLDGRIRWLNPAGAERPGYGREELSGRALGGTLIPLEELELRASQLVAEFGGLVAADASVLGARLSRLSGWNSRSPAAAEYRLSAKTLVGQDLTVGGVRFRAGYHRRSDLVRDAHELS